MSGVDPVHGGPYPMAVDGLGRRGGHEAVAEGAGRMSDPDFARFVAIAASSANETEYHALLARDLGYLTAESHREMADLIARVRSMLANLRKTLIA